MAFQDWAEEYDKKNNMDDTDDIGGTTGSKGGRSQATRDDTTDDTTDDTGVSSLYDDDMEDGV